MSGLEKLIRYDTAVLAPGLEKDGYKIRLQPVNDLAVLCHFETSDEGGLDVDYPPGRYAVNGYLGYSDQHNWPLLGNSYAVLPAEEEIYLLPKSSDLWGQENLSIAFGIRVDQSWSSSGNIECFPGLSDKFLIAHIDNTDLIACALDADGNLVIAWASGLELQYRNWYWLNFVISPTHIYLYLSGEGEEDQLITEAEISGIYDDTGNYDYMRLKWRTEQYYLIDEFIIRKNSNQIPRPTEPFKVYSTAGPAAVVSLDAGFNNTVWLPETLAFVDEGDFENGGIKMRLDTDNDNSPNFSDQPLTLEQARSLEPRVGRYLHLEFTFISDGYTQRLLTNGKINVRPESHIVVRREPEVIRRF